MKKNLRRFDHWYDAASSHLAFSFMWRIRFHIESSWLVVWNMNFIFHYIYGMSSETHWRTPSFFRGVGCPHQPARLISSFKATHLAKWDDLTRQRSCAQTEIPQTTARSLCVLDGEVIPCVAALLCSYFKQPVKLSFLGKHLKYVPAFFHIFS